MKRKLTTQILNEWRSNIWLALELFLVSVMVWYMLTGVYAKVALAMIPNCVDTRNTYSLALATLPEGTPLYDPSDTTSATDAVVALVERIRRNPSVEAAALTTWAIPNEGSYVGTYFRTVDAQGDTVASGSVALLDVTPEWFEVFRVEGANGESTEELGRIIERGELIATSNMTYFKESKPGQEEYDRLMRERFSRIPTELLGKYLMQGADSTGGTRLSGIVPPFRRFAMDMPTQSLLTQFNANSYSEYTPKIVVRVKEGTGESFAEELDSQGVERYRQGNHFLSGATSIEERASIINADDYRQLRTSGLIIGFLLMSVFLGLLGVFWFRTQQRVGEIAIRKVNGATSPDIFRRFLGEGLILLAATLPFTVAAAWCAVKYELTEPLYFYQYFDPGMFFISLAATYLLLALIIAAGIAFPARRAMEVESAEALKDE